MNKEEKTELERVAVKIEDEGFDYCFRRYSNFDEVKTKKFHRLRKAYIRAADALEEYMDQFKIE